MKNDSLFSAFLSSVTTFAYNQKNNFVDQIELNNKLLQIEYSGNAEIHNINLENLILQFYYSENQDLIIAAGIEEKSYYRGFTDVLTLEFFKKIDSLMESFSHFTWQQISNKEFLKFENRLLTEVVHPFLENNNSSDKCPLSDNCPYRLAIIESEGDTITDKIKCKIEQFRSMNIFSRLKLKFFDSEYQLDRIKT